MKYHICICAALKRELDIFRKLLNSSEIENIQVDFLLLGVGNFNTLYTLQEYLRAHKTHFLLNLGVCGYSVDALYKNTPVQISRIFHLGREKESLVPVYVNFAPLVSTACSDKIITSPQQILGENYVDMESYAVDFVATKSKIPYAILKMPLDEISQASKNVDIGLLKRYCEVFDIDTYLKKIGDFCTKQVYGEDDTQYLSFFRFTFSENAIFQTQKNKFGAFGIDFEKFFNVNKHLSKKDFLKKMQETNS